MHTVRNDNRALSHLSEEYTLRSVSKWPQSIESIFTGGYSDSQKTLHFHKIIKSHKILSNMWQQVHCAYYFNNSHSIHCCGDTFYRVWGWWCVDLDSRNIVRYSQHMFETPQAPAKYAKKRGWSVTCIFAFSIAIMVMQQSDITYVAYRFLHCGLVSNHINANRLYRCYLYGIYRYSMCGVLIFFGSIRGRHRK